MSRSRLFLGVTATLLLAYSAAAQADGPSPQPRGSFTVQTGYSPAEPTGIGSFHVYTSDRRLLQTLIGYSWTIHAWQHVKLSYHADLIPLTLVSDPAQQIVFDETDASGNTVHTKFVQRSAGKIRSRQGSLVAFDPAHPASPAFTTEFTITPLRLTTYGGGANPIALELHFRPRRRLQPFIFSSGGFLIFAHEEPLDRTSAFNFSYAFGGGVEIATRPQRAVIVGYKLLHFSNAQLGAMNPGVNTNFLYIGYRFGR